MISPLLSLSALLLTSSVSAIGYGVDISVPANLTQLKCLSSAAYTTILTRVFRPDGQVDNDGIRTMSTIQKEKMLVNTYAYMTPQANVGNGSLQIDKVYNALISSEIQFHTFYIQVSRASASWSSDTGANVQFIKDMCTRASYYGRSVGIYTSFGDWVAITGNVKTLTPNLVLWYSNVWGPGVTGESQPNINDFVAFGPFGKSQVRFKQFAMEEVVCGLNVNRDVVAPS